MKVPVQVVHEMLMILQYPISQIHKLSVRVRVSILMWNRIQHRDMQL
jgi:hypothetical protein